MIGLVTGKIGGGKTLYCVGRIVKHLARGGFVYTNIALNWDKLAALVRKRHKVILERDQLREIDLVKNPHWDEEIEWGSFRCPVLVVLDEIHLFFNSRDWAKTGKDHKDLLSFLSQSRKASVDLLFIVQVASTLEKQFRVQSEVEYSLRKLTDIHVPFLGALPLNRMLLITKDNADDPGRTAVLRRQLVPYDRALFGVYETTAFLDGKMQARSESVRRLDPLKLKRVRWWRDPMIGKVALGMLAAVMWVWFRLLT